MHQGYDQATAILSPTDPVVATENSDNAPLSFAQQISLGVGLLTIWLLSHFYRGFDHDGQLYAFQSLARLKPTLYKDDLFLFTGSQDQYTLFTHLYASLIEVLGLSEAAALLMVLAQTALLASGWWIVRRLISTSAAWFAVGIFILMPKYYGGCNVFHIAEDFLTARLLAEALSLGSIALFLYERRVLALLCVSVSLALHPLMTSPSVAALILMSLPYKRWPALIGSGIAILAVALACAYLAPFKSISIMDAQWLQIVRQRSEHLFVDDWRIADWHRLTLVLTTLLFAWSAFAGKEALRRTLLAVICVGAAGLLLSAVGTSTSMTLLLMGQPWRWLWIPTAFAILILAPAAYEVAKQSQIGRSCALILLSGWALADIAGGMLGTLALVLWIYRTQVANQHVSYAVWCGTAVAGIAALWVAGVVIQLVMSDFTTEVAPIAIERLRNVFHVALAGALVTTAFFYLVLFRWLKIDTLTVVLLFTVVLGFLLPGAVIALSSPPHYEKYERERGNFAVWRRMIPPNTNVFWGSDHLAVWMLLERPSYLSRSSSAGVVFSKEIALEVQRRAHQLEPYISAEQMLTGYRGPNPVRPLTVPTLRKICSDPSLGFVVSTVHLGFGVPNRSRNPQYKNAQLYDCRAIPPQS